MEKSDWLINIEETVIEAVEQGVLASLTRQRLGLDNLPSMAEKIEIHAKECSKCEEFKSVILNYVNDVKVLTDNYPDKTSGHWATKSPELKKVRDLHNAVIKPVRNHLGIDHKHPFPDQFRVRRTVIAMLVALILFVLPIPGWKLIYSLAVVGVGWLIGNFLDNKHRKSGWAVRRFDFSKVEKRWKV